MKKTILFCIGVMLLVSAAAMAAPTIKTTNGVVNASSYLPGIAQGSWFVIFGTNMGPATISVYGGALPFPTELSGTTVTFTPVGGGTAISARLWYTLAGQLAGLLPSGTAAGDYNVVVNYNGASAPYKVTVVARNFGFATQAQNGAGPAQATYGGLDLNRFTTGTLGQWATRPAKPGDSMVLWGTGIGADLNSDITGASSGDQTAAGQVKVVVGGVEVTPAYAGRSNGAPGLDQVNFTVPANVAPSCFVSIQVKAGGKTSNIGSIAVAAAGQTSCSHPTLTESQLKRLDQGGKIVYGSFSIAKLSQKISVPGLGSIDSSTETVGGSFGSYGVDSVGSANFSLLQIGACSVFRRTGSQSEIATGTAPAALDAGTPLSLNGPGASNKAVPRSTDKTYSLTLYSSGFGGFGGSGTPTLVEGTYSLAGPGGAEVGAFNTSVPFPGSFNPNIDAIPATIPRSQNLPVTWTGGGTGVVAISGFSASQSGGTQTDPIYDAAGFTCVAPASAGNFTVPSAVMLQLPPASADPTSGTIGLFTVFAINNSTFSAPLTAGGSIDQGAFSSTVGPSKTVGWN
jgi:uncharacterized protein (TIGR03437 family)